MLRLQNCTVRGLVGSLAASFACLLVALAFPVTSAQAARIHPLEVSETLPNEEEPFSVALNQDTHHFYVTSTGEDGFEVGRSAYNFDPDGGIDPISPELTGAPTLAGDRVAVDNSGSSTQGYAYLVGFNSDFSWIVQQFDQNGQATNVSITASSVPPDGTPQTGGLEPVVNEGAIFPAGIDVDDLGNIFIFDHESHAIDVFSSTGKFVKQLGAGVISAFPEAIALDEAGNIYVAAAGEKPIERGLYELDAAGKCVQLGCSPIDPAPIHGVVVDNATGTIFTTSNGSGNGSDGSFSEYEASTGKLLGVTHPAGLHSPAGIAVDETSGDVIIADGLPAREGTIKIFGPVEEVPTPVTQTPVGLTDHSVTLKGILKPEETPASTCFFEYVDQAQFMTAGFEAAAVAPCEPAGPFTGNGEEAVEAQVSGLAAGTTYHDRLVAENSSGHNSGEDVPFTTGGPAVSGTAISAAEETGVTLEGAVDPRGSSTTYRFEYLTQAAFEAGGWTGATQLPADGESLGEGEAVIPVSQRLEGLAPGTEYRFRIVAVGTGGAHPGTSEGPGVTFSTYGIPLVGLPDGRAYEQSSPTDKNGGNIQGSIGAVEASLDGDRITFFSNGGIPGGEGAQSLPTYLASRAADGSGWSTQGLLPPATYGPVGEVLGWDEGLTDFYGYATKSVSEKRLLVRSGASGAVSQIGPLAPDGTGFSYAGSSADGTVVLLESSDGQLVPGDLAGSRNVYAYDRLTGALVVAGLTDEGTVPAEGAIGGPYRWFENSSTEKGGAAENYFTQPTHAISGDGSRIFFTASRSARLYVRLNPFGESAELTPAQCRAPGNTKACTITVSAPEEGVADPGTPAAFLGASADGRLVYFLDRGKLTAGSTAGVGSDLYRYNVDTGELVDLTADSADNSGARVEGALAVGGPGGEDGYFVARGKLASGTVEAPLGETNLYRLHGTAIEFVARLGTQRKAGENGGETAAWTPTARVIGGENVTHTSRMSADGRTLLFRSLRRLTAYDNHGVGELYLYRVGQGISCISCNPTGEAPAGSAGFQLISPVGFVSPRTYAFETRNLSPDGDRVFFDSADRLVASDHNSVNDVYEWEAPDPAEEHDSCTIASTAYVPSSGGCLFLISGGTAGAGPSWFGDASEDGEDVFFFTPQSLVAQDKDELVDVYDARVGGGIASQNLTPSSPCEGETGCRGTASPAPPPSSTPGSSSFSGPGNRKPPAACKKGQVRKHGRCVKKHQKPKGKKKSKQGKKKSKKKAGDGKKGGRK
jgi:hypothetical protein